MILIKMKNNKILIKKLNWIIHFNDIIIILIYKLSLIWIKEIYQSSILKWNLEVLDLENSK